jgi:hypothetical protein
MLICLGDGDVLELYNLKIMPLKPKHGNTYRFVFSMLASKIF